MMYETTNKSLFSFLNVTSRSYTRTLKKKKMKKNLVTRLVAAIKSERISRAKDFPTLCSYFIRLALALRGCVKLNAVKIALLYSHVTMDTGWVGYL